VPVLLILDTTECGNVFLTPIAPATARDTGVAVRSVDAVSTCAFAVLSPDNPLLPVTLRVRCNTQPLAAEGVESIALSSLETAEQQSRAVHQWLERRRAN